MKNRLAASFLQHTTHLFCIQHTLRWWHQETSIHCAISFYGFFPSARAICHKLHNIRWQNTAWCCLSSEVSFVSFSSFFVFIFFYHLKPFLCSVWRRTLIFILFVGWIVVSLFAAKRVAKRVSIYLFFISFSTLCAIFDDCSLIVYWCSVVVALTG